METRPLGHTGIQVSVVCLGTMTFGEQNTAEDAREQLDFAVSEGISFIDTAEIYAVPVCAETYGKTEEIVGDWLVRRKKRDDVVIATKVAGPKISWIRGGSRLTRKHIVAAAEDSLRRLKTDYIDLYQTHWPDRNTNFFGRPNYRHDENENATPIAETVAAMRELQDSGKIRAFGVSNETPWGMLEHFRLAIDSGAPRPASVQNPYNLLNRSYEIGMAEISMRENCGLLPYSPLAFGALSGKYLGGKKPEGARLSRWGDYFRRYTTDKGVAATADYAAFAEKRGMSPAQLAIAFSVHQPFVTSSIIGATTMSQLRENIAAAALQLDEECRRDLETLGEKHFNPCP